MEKTFKIVNYSEYEGKYDEQIKEKMAKEPESIDIETMRANLYGYTFTKEYADGEIPDELSMDYWEEYSFENDLLEDPNSAIPDVIVERSRFSAELTPEEINILALLMKQGWVQRQVTSIENTRMKYTGSDFKMTSQANHLQKLLSLLEESRRDSFHMQRLYKRRSYRRYKK